MCEDGCGDFFLIRSDLDRTLLFVGESPPEKAEPGPRKGHATSQQGADLGPASKAQRLHFWGEIHSFMGRNFAHLVLKQPSFTLKSSMTSQRHHKFTLS